MRNGTLIILTAPSGTGKSTVAERVLADRPSLAFSVSHTTRPMRPGEVDGEDYYFVDDATFDGMVERDGFAEWAHVHAQRYGTSKAEVSRRLAAGMDVLFDIDPQGGLQLMDVYPEAVTVFMVPPSLAVLETRLRGRGTDSDEQIRIRLGVAREEIAAAHRYQYVVVNEDLDLAVADFLAIVD
ncbi:MAG: guanylate kinase, partial [Myxococcota bacterium]|nr:guanylate kinase [Myxococcota bacterium]